MSIERDQLRMLLVLAVLVGAFVMACWMPQRRRAQTMHERIDHAEQQLAVDRQSTRNLVSLAQEVFELRQVVSGAQRYVPAEHELAGLLKQISRDLEQQAVVEQEIQTRPVVHYSNYSTIPVSLRFRGTFLSVFGFLKQIESMQRLIRIDDLQVEGRAERSGELLEVRVELSAFFAPVEVKAQ